MSALNSLPLPVVRLLAFFHEELSEFTEMLGRSLARRVYGTRAQSNIIARLKKHVP